MQIVLRIAMLGICDANTIYVGSVENYYVRNL